MTNADKESRLLICTVGGSPQPIVATLAHWKPQRIRFIPSAGTRATIQEAIDEAAKADFEIDQGRYDVLELTDPEDLSCCLEDIRSLTPTVQEWANRGKGSKAIVDFTAGTKCMSAALALQARRWPCVFSYIGGERRNKEGVGVVETGSEKVVHQVNPWDALGYQAVEDFCLLFDQGAFDAATSLAEEARERTDDMTRKSEFSALVMLAKGYAFWDKFAHEKAHAELARLNKQFNNLEAVFGTTATRTLRSDIAKAQGHLQALYDEDHLNETHIADLLANADRRAKEGRFDDAVARLYRAVEAMAQLALKTEFGIESTAQVPLDRIPDDLRQKWSPRADNNGCLRLGLQDIYALLRAKKHKLGSSFFDLGLADQESPLSARNHSILAHGFEAISQKTFKSLRSKVYEMWGSSKGPSFPKLRPTTEKGD